MSHHHPGPPRVAVVGAGIAGATAARLLADAGCAVSVFDKSRGVGGRLATRRASWTDAQGSSHDARFDHGTLAFSAKGAVPTGHAAAGGLAPAAPGGAAEPAPPPAAASGFARFVQQCARDGLLAPWQPQLAPASYTPLDRSPLWVPVPDMPALCRHLLAGLTLHTGHTITALARQNDGPAPWVLHSAQGPLPGHWHQVVLALPAPQAAPLLQPYRADWAQRAQTDLPMAPSWALMGITTETAAMASWDLAWPLEGPLRQVVRSDRRPGRHRREGLAHWVLHATPEWSRTQLEAEPAAVQAALQQALAQWLGGPPLHWLHATVHRWRFANAQRASAVPGAHWWDSGLQLGVCGDSLGGADVEGAWRSASALAQAMRHGAAHPAGRGADNPPAPPGSTPPSSNALSRHGPVGGASPAPA